MDNNKNILEKIDNLLELSKKNLQENQFTKGEDAGKKYLEESIVEIRETLCEYKLNNKVYLEDELGDIFWDYLQAVMILKRDGYVDSVEGIFSHSLKKYTERLRVLDKEDDGEWKEWKKIKNKQKKELLNRHKKIYKK